MYPAPEIGCGKHNIFIKNKTKNKSCDGRTEQGKTVSFKNNKSQIYHLPAYYEMKHGGKHQKAHHHIAASTGGIAKCLQRHQLPERRIKKIDN